MRNNCAMDSFDVKLLNLLQHNSRLTVSQLSEVVPLTPSAISRRLKRLWNSNVIAGEAIFLSQAIRERQIGAIINIQLDRHQPDQVENLKRSLKEARQVQLCVEITGSSDVLLIVSVPDMESFNEFADDLARHALVKRYETSFIKKHVKASLAIHLDRPF